MLPFAIAHFMVTLGLAFMGFVGAYGSGMSDMDHGDRGAGVFTFLLGLWQFPLALIQWAAMAIHKDGRGLPAGALFPLAALSSLAFGYIVGVLFRPSQNKDQK